MAAFDRDDVTGNGQFTNDLRPDRGFPTSATSNAPAWIIGIVVVAAIIGVFAYESGPSRAPSMAPPPPHEMTAPPPVNPAPPPEAPKQP
jgi:hypothetical protein